MTKSTLLLAAVVAISLGSAFTAHAKQSASDKNELLNTGSNATAEIATLDDTPKQ